MPEPESVRRAFSRVQPLVEEVGRYVRDTLEPYCRSHNYLFADRLKTVGSLAEKLESGRYRAWSAVDDLYACTIVVPVWSHAPGVKKKLAAAFKVSRVVSRETVEKPPESFRFDGLRWYGTLEDDLAGERQPGLAEVVFEVQVVTAFEYAWIAVTHDLVYKADTVDWRRMRLAAQLKASVEQIEALIVAFDSVSNAIVISPWPESDTKGSIVTRFSALFEQGLIPETLRPLSWRRLADNILALVKSFERDRSKVGKAVEALIGSIEADFYGEPPLALPTTGTLFQYVESIVARPGTPGNLTKFTVVPSRELTDFYGAPAISTPFVFDGLSQPAKAPEAGMEPHSDGALVQKTESAESDLAFDDAPPTGTESAPTG